MSGQRWDTSLYDDKHSFVTMYGEAMLSLLEPQTGQRILDVGCGTGHLTAQIAASGAEVAGLDSSAAMLAQARAAYPHITFLEADAASFAVDQPFDAVFSNAALHWVRDAAGAVRSIRSALKPDGRFVAEFGGHGNIPRIAQAVRESIAELHGRDVPHVWYFPSIAEYGTLLESHGLLLEAAWLFDRVTPLDGDNGMADWIRMFGGGTMPGFTEADREPIIARAVAKLEPQLRINGRWYADYKRLRVVAKNGSATPVVPTVDRRSAESA
jgi:trans-aconitate methyltransferase